MNLFKTLPSKHFFLFIGLFILVNVLTHAIFVPEKAFAAGGSITGTVTVVDSKGLVKDPSVFVYDDKGASVNTAEITKTSGKFTYKSKDLPNGTYLLVAQVISKIGKPITSNYKIDCPNNKGTYVRDCKVEIKDNNPTQNFTFVVNSCEDNGNVGNAFTCESKAENCATKDGKEKYDKDNSTCSGYGADFFCCKNIKAYNDAKAAEENAKLTPCNGTDPKQACGTQSTAPDASACPGNNWKYQDDPKSNAWCAKNGGGGGKDFCYSCVKAGTTTGTPTLTPTPTTIPASTDFCASHGGVKPGMPAEPMCGEKAFDGTEAAKTKANGNPYCDKTYKVRYHCVDGDYWGADEGTGKCSTTPWCPVTVTPVPGSGEACTASNAVGGKCPDNKPLCNTPTGEAPQCVAARSQTKDQHCSKDGVCSTGFCKDTGATTPRVCADNLTPTATPTPMVPTSDQCPVIDQSDGRPNTCYGSADPALAAIDIPGYRLKSSDRNALPNVSCSQHTGGLNPWCWHKNAPTGTLTPTPTATSQLATGCPNIDADNKANTCEDAPSTGTSCSTPGFKHKSPNNGGDAACTSFRNNIPSWCCHQN